MGEPVSGAGGAGPGPRTVVLGIDVGGSGIKGAPVDLAAGALAAERLRIPTPRPATPDAVAEVVTQIVRHFDWHGPFGCALPSVVKAGVVHTAANVDPSWIGAQVEDLLERATGSPAVALNDADAAGLAEMEYGAGRHEAGTVLMLTFGTGIGSALFRGRVLVPNTELGHLRLRGRDVEHRASDRVRQEKGWSFRKWAKRVNEVLAAYEALLFPDLIVFGGGISKKHERFFPYLETKAPIVPAQMQNEAGIVGAAWAAAARLSERDAGRGGNGGARPERPRRPRRVS